MTDFFDDPIFPKQSNKFNFDFSFEKFHILFPNKNSLEWYNELVEYLPDYNITTKERVAGFLAQTAHESLNFTVLEENLNYSTQGLLETFPSRFKSSKEAATYSRNPRKIASYVYANRMGNGSPQTEDGWNFRGRGIIQITGKDNYSRCSRFLFKDLRLLENPNLLLERKYAVLSACWFWTINDINKYCDKKDIIKMTKIINGGTKGLQDRTNKFKKALSIL